MPVINTKITYIIECTITLNNLKFRQVMIGNEGLKVQKKKFRHCD